MPRLYKSEKLCSQTSIDALWGHSRGPMSTRPQSAVAYPLRAVWGLTPHPDKYGGIKFLVSVPKKRLRRAVDRVLMRRRIREAYRLYRDLYPLAEGVAYDVVFVYVADTTLPYSAVVKGLTRLLRKISGHDAVE